jgi:hypothetical protein
MRTKQRIPPLQALETDMKKTALLAGAAAAATILAGGIALAQMHGPGHGPRTGQPMGPGAMHRMGPGMGHQMGPGMGHQMGPGMMQQQQHMQQMMQQMHRGPGTGPAHRGPGHTFLDPTNLDTLKRELAITPAQEEAWTKYAKTVEDASTALAAAREGVDPDAVRNMSPADRFAFVSKIREQAQKQHEAVKAAADELLAALDDTQKAKAQDILPGLADGPGPRRDADARPSQQEHRH